jgi:hypothetical protein
LEVEKGCLGVVWFPLILDVQKLRVGLLQLVQLILGYQEMFFKPMWFEEPLCKEYLLKTGVQSLTGKFLGKELEAGR